MDNLRGLPV